jgi:hypothetical protein
MSFKEGTFISKRLKSKKYKNETTTKATGSF